MKNPYALLAEIRAKKQVLDEQESVLKETIAADLEKKGVETLENEYGAFYFTARKIWTYPKAVKTMEDQLKLAQIDAQEKGKATFKSVRGLSYRPAA